MIISRRATWLGVLIFPVACGLGSIALGREWNHPSAAPSRRHLCNGCPAYQEIAPPGSSLNAMWATQVANGLATRQTLYHYDFVRGNDRLTPRGHLQLEKILRRLAESPYPVVIEATGLPKLDEARRIRVLDALDDLNLPDPQLRVIVGPPPTRPLDGIDAVQLHQRLLGLSSGVTSAPAIAVPTPVPVPGTR